MNMMDDETRKKLIADLTANWNNLPSSTFTSASFFSWEPKKVNYPVETDEQGNIYGYKVLIWDMRDMQFISPIYPAQWSKIGVLESDREPTQENSHGIYFKKLVQDSELDDYRISIERRARSLQNGYGNGYLYIFIVRCVLSGVIVEGETGFRSQYAKIEGVMINGNWTTYQDFQNESQYNNRRRFPEYPTFDKTPYESDYRAHTTGWNTSTKLANPQDEEG